ncbi:MAG: hypothetical protein AAF671_12845 [Pseudomonadota bacterium]
MSTGTRMRSGVPGSMQDEGLHSAPLLGLREEERQRCVAYLFRT